MLDQEVIKNLIATLRREPCLVIMDTEQTCWEGSWERRLAGKPGEGELREVIQIGAVMVETEGFTVLKEFEHIVRPKVNPILSDFCVNFTGVTQERIDREGTSFEDGFNAFGDFVEGYPVLVYNADEEVFVENVEISGFGCYIETFLRLRPWLEQAGINMSKVNSGKVAKYLGSERTYREHDALADVISMADGLGILANQGE